MCIRAWKVGMVRVASTSWLRWGCGLAMVVGPQAVWVGPGGKKVELDPTSGARFGEGIDFRIIQGL
jgi:hypothetical protein